MVATIVKLPRLYYGQLLVTAYLRKNAAGECVYACTCACGDDTLERSLSQLMIRKMQSCAKCRAAAVEDKVADRAADRAKDRRRERAEKHADHLATREAWA